MNFFTIQLCVGLPVTSGLVEVDTGPAIRIYIVLPFSRGPQVFPPIAIWLTISVIYMKRRLFVGNVLPNYSMQ